VVVSNFFKSFIAFRAKDEARLGIGFRGHSAYLTFLRTAIIVVILITGYFFALLALDRKVYSFDESLTSLRISRYTWMEMVQQDFQGKTISVEDLLANTSR
jgi:hypothetical protein